MSREVEEHGGSDVCELIWFGLVWFRLFLKDAGELYFPTTRPSVLRYMPVLGYPVDFPWEGKVQTYKLSDAHAFTNKPSPIETTPRDFSPA